MSKYVPGLIRRPKAGGGFEWHIDKRIKDYGRLCESTGTDDAEEAARYLAKRIDEIRNARAFGVRPRRLFRQAATKYLEDFAHKPGISRAATALKDMDEFIGDKCIDEIHNETFKPYIRRNPAETDIDRRATKSRTRRKRLKIGTINRNLGVVRRILRLCERLWRDEQTNLTWLERAPFIQMLEDREARVAYPLSWAEQDLLFGELTDHLRDIAEFDLNTGLRDQELCGLKWNWEQRVPELDSPGIQRSVFVLPAVKNKNRQARVVVLNDRAQAIVEKMRGQHPVYVFTWVKEDGVRDRIGRIRNTGWVNARRRAAEKYPAVLGKEAPLGFRELRAHDLRHTAGRRLRAAGVSKEDRKDLLGHKSGDVTTNYSAAELMSLIKAANLIVRSKDSPTLTVLRLVA
jgi:integrase